MDWLYPRRRGPEWKQSWTGRTMASMSMPPLPLLAVFAIVIFLLSISQSRNYKEQIENAKINFHIFLFFVPILLIFFLMVKPVLFSEGGWLNYFSYWVNPRRRQLQQYYYSSMQRSLGGGGFPWGVAVLLVALLVLVSYQSSFQSKWFPALRRSPDNYYY